MAYWDISSDDLTELVKNRDLRQDRAYELQNKYGGVERVTELLKTDRKRGIDADNRREFESRLEQFGNNKPEEKISRKFWSFLLEALSDRTLIILCVAAAVSIILGVTLPPPGESRANGWIEGTAILIAVAIVSLVTAVNDYQKDRKFAELSKASEDRKIKVIRNGKKSTISTFDVVVGDLVTLEAGDYIPADMLYLKGQDVTVDESSMTGEPDAVPKSEHDPYFLSNCMVMQGIAKGIVIAVGKNSQWGKIKSSLEKEEEKTPLQEKLEDLAEFIGKLGVGAAILTFIALLVIWSVRTFMIEKQSWNWNEMGIIVSFLITSITIIVVAVPEGLPLAVTISLAYSMLQMMKDQNLVRHLAACETMGGATSICCDKTGTLTQNEMTVVKLYSGGKKWEKTPKDAKDLLSGTLKNLLVEGMAVNSSAYFQNIESKKECVGAKTECALIQLVENMGEDYENLRDKANIKKVFPFSSKKKRMSTLIETEKGFRLHCKGACESILERCTRSLDLKGEENFIEDSQRNELQELMKEWASDGLRILSIAYVEFPEDYSIPKGDPRDVDKDLILLGIVGIEDPLRPETYESVKQCHHAGITVRMLTGDNLLTAKKIASRCGILTEEGEAIEGPQLRSLSNEELEERLPRLQVIARCSPEDKYLLVKCLKGMGEVVAVTGDGTNDAPQLREADVGFAMGISGTEVAKGASDIILLDDNFSSIEKAVLWGRNVYDSIRKFVQFQLTVNIVAVGVAFVGAVSKGESPLSAVQLLWVNLIMDTMAALALATESPTKKLLDRPPYGRNSPLITKRMWKMIIGQALFQFGVLFFCLYGLQLVTFLEVPNGTSALRRTIIFNTFVFCQLFNEINCRKLEDELNIFQGIFRNWIFIGVVFFTVVVQVLIVEFGGQFSNTVPLNLIQWVFCIVIGSISLPIGMLLRFIPVPKEEGPRRRPPEEEEHLIPKEEEIAVEIPREERKGKGWKKARDVATKIRVLEALRRPVVMQSPTVYRKRRE